MSFRKLYFEGQAYGDDMSQEEKDYLEKIKETVPSVGVYDKKL